MLTDLAQRAGITYYVTTTQIAAQQRVLAEIVKGNAFFAVKP